MDEKKDGPSATRSDERKKKFFFCYFFCIFCLPCLFFRLLYEVETKNSRVENKRSSGIFVKFEEEFTRGIIVSFFNICGYWLLRVY